MTKHKYEIAIGRLNKKISHRDRKIKGLERNIKELQRVISTLEVTGRQINFEKALQRAICNLRMIPVLGFRSEDKVIEVKNVKDIDKKMVGGA